jgi:hypothetical protein
MVRCKAAESINFAYLTVALFCIGYLFGQSNGIDAVADLLDDHTLRAKARDAVLGTRGPFFALWVFLGGQAVLYAWLWLARVVREDDMRKPHEKEQEK